MKINNSVAQKNKWLKPLFSDTSQNGNENPPKKAKPSDDYSFEFAEPASVIKAIVKAVNNDNGDTSNWLDNLVPRCVEELAIHQKKIEEIQNFLRNYEKQNDEESAMLLISGPPGSGKYTSVKVIAKELGYSITEWMNPVDIELLNDRYDFENNTENIYQQNQKDLFDDFLYKTSRYCSLFEDSDMRVLIVKDYPNNFLLDPKIFHASLEKYKERGGCPLIFLATDTSSRKVDIVYNLFPQNVLSDSKICQISLNSLSNTLMKKAMKRLVQLMKQENLAKIYSPPSQEVIDSIIESSQGDLRNATINLHFASLKNAPLLLTENVFGKNTEISKRVDKSKSKKVKKLKSVGCDETITMMHALGRVFNPKYELSDEKDELFVHSPENITESFSSQPKSFVSLIHSNYVKRFCNIDDICLAADCLSLSDKISTEYRDDAMAIFAMNIAIRGMMVHNKQPAGGWQPIRAKKKFDKPNTQQHVKQLENSHLKTSSISTSTFIIDYKTYVNIVRSSDKANQ